MRWYVLGVLCGVYTLSIADRYAMSTVLEPVRIELRLTDSGAAFLTSTALALVYVAFGIPIAWLADRYNRRNLIAASVLAWWLIVSTMYFLPNILASKRLSELEKALIVDNSASFVSLNSRCS